MYKPNGIKIGTRQSYHRLMLYSYFRFGDSSSSMSIFLFRPFRQTQCDGPRNTSLFQNVVINGRCLARSYRASQPSFPPRLGGLVGSGPGRKVGPSSLVNDFCQGRFRTFCGICQFACSSDGGHPIHFLRGSNMFGFGGRKRPNWFSGIIFVARIQPLRFRKLFRLETSVLSGKLIG
jgi:hypothetical protein